MRAYILFFTFKFCSENIIIISKRRKHYMLMPIEITEKFRDHLHRKYLRNNWSHGSYPI